VHANVKPDGVDGDAANNHLIHVKLVSEQQESCKRKSSLLKEKSRKQTAGSYHFTMATKANSTAESTEIYRGNESMNQNQEQRAQHSTMATLRPSGLSRTMMTRRLRARMLKSDLAKERSEIDAIATTNEGRKRWRSSERDLAWVEVENM
jgi:hypothetical protein